jgi:hypothetical protein
MLFSMPIFILAAESSIALMNKAFTLFSLSVFIFYGIYGQHSAKIEKVIYDPLLWKVTMKLTKSQCEEISRINISFYQLLYAADNLDSASRMRIDELYFLVHARSEQIWRIFSERQKRKWARLNLSLTNDRHVERLLSRFLKKPPKPMLALAKFNIASV